MTSREKDDVSGTETTGHEWDGIRELDTPMPRWWLWTYLATVAFAAGYVVAYPAIPLITGATPGVLGYSSRADLVQEVAAAKAGQKDQIAQIANLSLEDIRKDPNALQFALAGGKAAFRINCIQCHGSGAAGGNGYPNLNDDDWLWGGTLDQIHTTLQHGVRYLQDADTRQPPPMPVFGAADGLPAAQINDVAEYVLQLSGGTYDAAAAQKGTTIFKDNCASCHGVAGEGNRDLGAPRLNDAIALYAFDKAGIVAQINKPRAGVMPAWSTRLDEVTVKQLAVYVHELGGGEMPTP